MSNYRHGWSKTRLYNVWNSMRARCENKNVAAYPDYGGRGITVCNRWMKFENFLADMGKPPHGMTLERRDNDKGYCPDNCLWADRKAQGRNKRGIRTLCVKGIEKPLVVWAEEVGIDSKTIWQRLHKGWTPDEAVLIPIVTRRKGIKRGEPLRYHCLRR